MDSELTALESTTDDFQEQLLAELQTTRTTLNEITATLAQSQNELNRLTQIKGNVTAQLQQLQGDSDSVSKSDIRNAFNSALDAQQRLLVMRGQLDKMQEQKNALQRYKTLLEKIVEYLQGHETRARSKNESSDGIATLEMLITSQESERQRLSRQMHDGPAQALSNFIVQSEIASRMYEIDPAKAKDELDKLKNSAMGTFQKIRSYITELRPMMLDDLGLVPTIKRYINNLKEQTGVDISLNITGTYLRLKPYLEVYLFRAMQELIGNSIKHNLDNVSKIKIDVNLTLDNSLVKALIKDNGKGFEPLEIQSRGGLGLKLIRERALLLGGSLEIKSSDSDGTEITLTIPIEDEPVAE
ncbi:MAG: two-component system NarL family sensor histidine kinase DegS [Chloroflexi bacterium]|nr:MAG: two-component system NarL family sensor histidine kinase DegS [Chloroflexota bacterium]